MFKVKVLKNIYRLEKLAVKFFIEFIHFPKSVSIDLPYSNLEGK